MADRFKLIHEEDYHETELYEAATLEELEQYLDEKGGGLF